MDKEGYMTKKYIDVVDHIKSLLDCLEEELRCKNCENSHQDLYFIFFKICKGIRTIDATAYSLQSDTDSFPLLNELHRCQDITHRIQSNHTLRDQDPDFFSQLIHAVTRLCDSIFEAYKKVYENALVRDFI